MPLTAEAVREGLQSWLSSQTITAAERITGGWETEIWSVSFQDRAPQILRIFTGLGAETKAPHEFAVIEALGQAGYPVPKVYGLETDPGLFGNPFILMEQVQGPTLGHAYDVHPERRPELEEQFVRLLVDLHQLDTSALPPKVAPAYRPDTLVNEHLHKMLKIVEQVGWEERFRPMLQWLDRRSREIACPRPSMLHGDYHSWNILLRESGEASVIDWSGGELGDRRLDLAWTLLLIDPKGGSELAQRIRSRYEELSGQPLSDMDYFDAYALSRRLFSLVITYVDGAEALGMHPDTTRLIRRNPGQLRGLYDRLHSLTGVAIPAVETLLAAANA